MSRRLIVVLLGNMLTCGVVAKPPLWRQYANDAQRTATSATAMSPRGSAPAILWEVELPNAAAEMLVTGDGDVIFGGAYGRVAILRGDSGAVIVQATLRCH